VQSLQLADGPGKLASFASYKLRAQKQDATHSDSEHLLRPPHCSVGNWQNLLAKNKTLVQVENTFLLDYFQFAKKIELKKIYEKRGKSKVKKVDVVKGLKANRCQLNKPL